MNEKQNILIAVNTALVIFNRTHVEGKEAGDYARALGLLFSVVETLKKKEEPPHEAESKE